MNSDLLVVPSAKNSSLFGSKKNKELYHSQLVRSAGSLWMYLHFPDFSLEALTRNIIKRQPCVLAAKIKKAIVVTGVNSAAQALGIKPGTALESFYIDEHVQVLQRNKKAEDFALESLCDWALQFTPKISKVNYRGLLLEVNGSLKLFSGVDNLIKRMEVELKSLGYRVKFSIAPVPSAAVLFGEYKPNKVILDKLALKKALIQTPVSALSINQEERKILKDLGVLNLGDCRRLPRSGLRARLSSQFIERMDCLFGDAPEYVDEFVPRNLFESVVYFPGGSDEIKSILLAVQNLLRELHFYLFCGNRRPSRLIWQLENIENDRNILTVNCDTSSGCESTMQLLLRHISAQKLMSKPLGSVRLKTLDVSENSHIKKDLFYNQQEEKIIIGCQNLVCRLKERLGEGIVFFLEKVSSHRPEQNFYCTNVNSHGLKSSTTCGSARPLWLVKKPIKLSVTNQQPQYQGALTIKIERERILSNWWEHTIIARDYFIASTARGNRIWIYKEIGVANSWYLQGFFD